MEAYLRQGDLPADAEVRAFLENLALDTLLQEAGPSNAALLRAATLFDLPVPEPVIEVLAGQVGGSAARLRGLGLLDPYPDLHDPARLALAASPLAAGRIDPLTADEQAALAAVSTGPLLAAWGGPAPQPGRDLVLDLQLARLALLADDPAVAAACAPGAVAALRSGPAADAVRLGQDAIGLLDRHGHTVPLDLLRQTADAALTSGDGEAGEALLDRAAQQAEAGGEQGTSPLDRARVIAERARRLVTRGEPDQADQLLRHARQLFTAAGSEREAAAAMGEIADIAYRRGDYDEALRIRREVQLPVYERLGDTRSAAIAWGNIADIAYQRGDYDEALRIRREVQLPAFERLGDTRRPPSPGARSPTSPTSAGTTTRPCGSAARSSCRSSSGSATPGRPPSPGARSPTSPTSAGTTTRPCGSAARSSCPSSSGSATPGRPPSPGAGSPTSPTSAGTTTRPCGSAARSSCRSTSGSATPGRPPSPGARSPTSPTGGATMTRRLSCSASGWR